MTELLSDIDAPSDAELISRVRGGDVAAYGELFARHKGAAHRLGRQLVRGPDSDDLVAEAFAKVLQVLQGGGGPDVAFRAYLLTAVRRLHVDRVRAGSRLQTSDDMSQFDPGIPFQDTAVASFESGAAAKAFASLPERWQLVLWHLEVEGQKPADIAPLLGMSANSVSALAYRAREGLRQAFLTMHLADIAAEECRWVTEHLGGYVRKGLSRRDVTKVEGHLEDCRRCTAMYLELSDVNSNLAGIIAPLLLGAAAAGYAASSGTAGVTGLLVALSGRVRDVFLANTAAATAATVAAGVATVATAGFVIANVVMDDAPVVAQPPVPTATVGTPNAAVPPRLPLGSASPATTRSPSDAPSTPATPSASPSATTSMLPSDAPATIPAFAASTAPADAPLIIDPGPGGDPGDGINAGQNTDPGAQPTQPAPSQLPPTPSAPVPTQPAPSQPAPTTPVPTSPASPVPATPAATSPAPSSPAPTTPAPSSPSPSSPAPPAAEVNLAMTVGQASAAGSISVELSSLPSDLVGLEVALDSDEGTTFLPGLHGDCLVAAADSTRADCSLAFVTSGVGRLVPRHAAPSDMTFEIPLDYAIDLVSEEVTVTVTGHRADEESADRVTDTAVVTYPSFAMTPLEVLNHEPGEDVDIFHMSTTIKRIPEDTGAVSLKLSGDASFAEVTNEAVDLGCVRVGTSELQCSGLARPEATVTFDLLYAGEGTESVTITASSAGMPGVTHRYNPRTIELARLPYEPPAVDGHLAIGAFAFAPTSASQGTISAPISIEGPVDLPVTLTVELLPDTPAAIPVTTFIAGSLRSSGDKAVSCTGAGTRLECSSNGLVGAPTRLHLDLHQPHGLTDDTDEDPEKDQAKDGENFLLHIAGSAGVVVDGGCQWMHLNTKTKDWSVHPSDGCITNAGLSPAER